ncbi:MAG: dihydrofolate reductase family protein [Acidobacteria bacterium]|nr:dihydrofolate reductase family protein [Acidobacteriota bacterium]
MSELLRLFPIPVTAVPLKGLYLSHALRSQADSSPVFVYANFIASLDGRIAINSHTGALAIPQSIVNPRDWRLFQELAAQADVLLSSGQYVRQLANGTAQDLLPLGEEEQYEDLHARRRAQGLTPQPAVVIVSASLDLPFTDALLTTQRALFVATGLAADTAKVQAIERRGITVLFAGTGQRVQGRSLIAALEQQGLKTIYSIAGSEVLATLLADHVLDRLYLTQVPRILGGASYATLVEGATLCPPADFELHSLYYEVPTQDHRGQLFGVYNSEKN